MATLGERLRGADLLHVFDNLSALAGFIGGTASQEGSAAMFAIFHIYLVRYGARYLAEHVESKASVADGPPRNGQADADLQALGCHIIGAAIPRFVQAHAQPYQLLVQLCSEANSANTGL